MLAPIAALAQTAAPASPVTLSNDKPIEVSSDALEVQQDKNEAIFTGNVIATQGTINMRADKMIVHYISNDSKSATPAAPGQPAPAKPAPRPASKPAAADGAAAPAASGIERIDSSGNVIFTNPTDTAKGDFSVYDVAKQTLDLTGTVILTRDKNILKGTHMTYYLDTGRSVLTAGDTTVANSVAGAAAPASGNGRVHGLFVPQTSNTTTNTTGKATTTNTTTSSPTTTSATTNTTTGNATTSNTTTSSATTSNTITPAPAVKN